ncbi:hypothetical protein [Rhizobium oryzicola]|uniref:Transmembrane protein n=1 Tax=Rhizobium oryzicola TaxID=1232668 RepID=A0ABT8SXJ7_9HYPH|nr:hypothetical protein [Rhizobium oryzicola]MDO1583081.1 hypothetical protein [Rhizobium oryzicola]
MSSAKERLNNIMIDIDDIKSRWEVNVGSPYVRAYDAAVDNFNRETKAQGERDRALAELFVFGASILTGSIMMAAFATTSVRVLAGRAMLNVICNNNLNRTFEMVHAASGNKTVMFALGGVLDQAKKIAGEHVKTASERLVASTSIASAPTSVNYMTRISDFIKRSGSCLHELLKGVRDDSSISESDKAKVADLAASIPFCNPPSGNRIDEQRLAQKMELLFYMAAVLDSDQLVTYAPATGGDTVAGMGRDVEYSRKSIAQMPSATDYPKATAPRYTGRPFQPFEPGQKIEYNNIGSGIRDRINKLSMATGNGQFYPQQNFAEKLLIDPTSMTQMVKAEQIINRLATEARPRQLTDVRMI